VNRDSSKIFSKSQPIFFVKRGGVIGDKINSQIYSTAKFEQIFFTWTCNPICEIVATWKVETIS